MKKPKNNCASHNLDHDISILKDVQTKEFNELKLTLTKTADIFNANNITKIILSSIRHNVQLKNESIALAAGYISQELFVGKSQTKVRLLIGTVIRNVVSLLATKYFESNKNKM